MRRFFSVLTAALAITLAPGSVSSALAASSVPTLQHVYVIVLENKEFGSIIGNANAPYINALARDHGLATAYYGVTHPSEPNYLAMFAGSTMGVHDDGVHNLGGRNLADQLSANGRSWRVYAQNYPGNCSMAATAHGGVDLVGKGGWYARKHNPAISFTDISSSSSRCANIQPLHKFSPSAADFELIVPNMVNSMHDGTIRDGDNFVKAMVPRITGSAAFANSLLVVTWDEGSSSLHGGGRVATIVVSQQGKTGFRSSVHHDHYSLLRTIESGFGLGCLRNTCSANDLREFFR